MQDLTLQDLTMMDQIAQPDYAGTDNDGSPPSLSCSDGQAVK